MLNKVAINGITVEREREREREREHKLTKGISLIVLVITIIIVIILAGAIILNLSDSNPIESANKAKFVSNVSTYREDLALTILNKYSESRGVFDPKSITDVTGTSLKKYIKSMKDTDKNKFSIMLRRT